MGEVGEDNQAEKVRRSRKHILKHTHTETPHKSLLKRSEVHFKQAYLRT